MLHAGKQEGGERDGKEASPSKSSIASKVLAGKHRESKMKKKVKRAGYPLPTLSIPWQGKCCERIWATSGNANVVFLYI